MAGKATKGSIPSNTTNTTPAANKDLSCLRCRKKKAKCSKTRPTCTRCARSNQPCEYPDAPPNLTDLSQKVLTLYDTLKELEGEFLVKYMQTIDEDRNEEEEHQIENIEFTQQQIEPQIQVNMNQIIEEEVGEPAGWSMSLTPNGLSIHAITRNLYEFNEFAKTISHQIIRDFGPNYLPKNWDPDAEGYFEQESDIEELDEDEYLITVPVISTCSLLLNNQKLQYSSFPPLNHNEKQVLIALIQGHYAHMLEHLVRRYQTIHEIQFPHHLVILMLQLKSYLPLEKKEATFDTLTQICILTAYVVSITMLPAIESLPPIPLWYDCTEYASMLLIDLILATNKQQYPMILCCTLIAWINNEHQLKSDTMIHIALRILCNSNWQEQEPAWQILIAALLYLDIYFATFQCKRPQLRGDGQELLWKAAIQLKEPSRWNDSNMREVCMILEARLMCLLNKVISLFYQDEKESIDCKKIDVDEVLTLVRDVELWEQELPAWAVWSTTEEELKMHIHMIHNIVKILLFRPFTSSVENEQTFTKTTFLDMSISSLDRLTICLSKLHNGGFWIMAAKNLTVDVSKRVLSLFDNDQEVIDQLNKIQSRVTI